MSELEMQMMNHASYFAELWPCHMHVPQVFRVNGLTEKLGNDNTEVILFLVMAKNIELDRSFIAETCQQYVVAVQWCMGLYYSILRMICTMTRTYCLS